MCGITKTKEKQKKQQKQFIQEVSQKHNGIYDYSKVNYNHAHQKIEIICTKHGGFFQTPNSHLRGRGCPKCKQGEGHFWYGKPAGQNGGYCGTYNKNTFRSLSELFWMIEMENKKISFIGLDQFPIREKWQVKVNYTGRPGTYCADFYVPSTNEIVDIKPLWRLETAKEKEKIKQGKIEYEKLGFIFNIIDVKSVKIKESILKNLVKENLVKFSPASIKKYEKRCLPRKR